MATSTSEVRNGGSTWSEHDPLPAAAEMSARKEYYYFLQLKAVESMHKGKEAAMREMGAAGVHTKL